MILCILQARIRSVRLPGKVMLSLQGQPMLSMQIERLKRSKLINDIVLATSKDPADDLLVPIAKHQDIKLFRGSLHIVLDRFYGAACQFGASVIVRVTGDCPVIDPAVIDDVISAYFDRGCDYISNSREPTFPDGLDVEVFSFEALARAHQEARLPSELEHVTPFIVKNTQMKVMNYAHAEDLSAFRWTVDELEDYILVSKIYESLYPSNSVFGFKDILALFKKNPSLLEINNGFVRNEGMIRSKYKDEEFLRSEDANV